MIVCRSWEIEKLRTNETHTRSWQKKTRQQQWNRPKHADKQSVKQQTWQLSSFLSGFLCISVDISDNQWLRMSFIIVGTRKIFLVVERKLLHHNNANSAYYTHLNERIAHEFHLIAKRKSATKKERQHANYALETMERLYFDGSWNGLNGSIDIRRSVALNLALNFDISCWYYGKFIIR